MEVTVNKADLSRALSLAIGSVEKTVVIPMLGNYQLKAEGDNLYVAATDLKVSFFYSVPATVTVPGSVALAAKKFEPYVKSLLTLTEENLKLRVTDNLRVSIRCGRNSTFMPGMAADTFPDVDVVPVSSTLSIPSDRLHQALARVLCSVSEDEVKYVLNGAYLLFTTEGLTAASTNYHVLSVMDVLEPQNVPAEGVGFILPTRALRELVTLLESRAPFPVLITVGETNVQFSFQGIRFIAQLIDGKYIDYGRAVNGFQFPYKALLPAGAMRDVLNRVGRFAEERGKAVILSFSENGLCILATTSDSGTAEESMDVNYVGPTIETKVNAQYVNDFLRHAGNNPIEIGFNDKNKPTEWRIEGDNSYRYYIMPMVT